jgi:hypothetical protein
MLHHEKSETLQPIISSVGCLCENSTCYLYKYQVTLMVFFIHFCFRIK